MKQIPMYKVSVSVSFGFIATTDNDCELYKSIYIYHNPSSSSQYEYWLLVLWKKKKHNLLVSKLGVPSVLLSIDGLVVWPTDSLHEAEAGIGPHGSVHLITWKQE